MIVHMSVCVCVGVWNIGELREWVNLSMSERIHDK